MRNLLLMLVCFTLSPNSLMARTTFDVSQPLQLLEKFGIRNGDFGDSSRVSVGKGKRKGDSPIYYIKLPPMPHFYSANPMATSQLAPPKTFHQLKVDFTNNGKPEQIYHWNYKPHVPMNVPDLTSRPSSSGSYMNNELFNPVAMPPSIPLLPQKPLRPIQKPLISIKKGFIYNGKPSGIYIWKPRQTVTNPTKYKHHYFKHFNY